MRPNPHLLPGRGSRGNARSYSYPGSGPTIHANSPAVEQQRQTAIAEADEAGRPVGPRTSLVDAQHAAAGTNATPKSADMQALENARPTDVYSPEIQKALDQAVGTPTDTRGLVDASMARNLGWTVDVPHGTIAVRAPVPGEFSQGPKSTIKGPDGTDIGVAGGWQQQVLQKYREIGTLNSEGNKAYRTAYQDAVDKQGAGNFDAVKLADQVMYPINEARRNARANPGANASPSAPPANPPANGPAAPNSTPNSPSGASSGAGAAPGGPNGDSGGGNSFSFDHTQQSPDPKQYQPSPPTPDNSGFASPGNLAMVASATPPPPASMGSTGAENEPNDAANA